VKGLFSAETAIQLSTGTSTKQSKIRDAVW